MSHAPAGLGIDFTECVSCKGKSDNKAEVQLNRHALPCSHIYCSGCAAQVTKRQEAGEKVQCACKGCLTPFARTAMWPVALCSSRPSRIASRLSEVFGDQGNVGDAPPPRSCTACHAESTASHDAVNTCTTCGPTVALCEVASGFHERLGLAGHRLCPILCEEKTTGGPNPGHDSDAGHDTSEAGGSAGAAAAAATAPGHGRRGSCRYHNLPLQVVDVEAREALCHRCLIERQSEVRVMPVDAARKAALADSQTGLEHLAGFTLSPSSFVARINAWGADETSRVRTWSQRVARLLRQTEEAMVSGIGEVCTRRLALAKDLYSQRLALQASLQECPSHMTEAVDPVAALHVSDFARQVSNREFRVPAESSVIHWAELPSLAPWLAEDLPDQKLLPAVEVHRELAKLMDELPVYSHTLIPTQRVDPVQATVTRVVPIDDELVALGCDDAPVRVWSVKTGTLVRAMHGLNEALQTQCRALCVLPRRLLVSGGITRSRNNVICWDIDSGLPLQVLEGFGASVYGLAWASGALGVVSTDKRLSIWRPHAAGATRGQGAGEGAAGSERQLEAKSDGDRPASTEAATSPTLTFVAGDTYPLPLTPRCMVALASGDVAIGGADPPDVVLFSVEHGRVASVLTGHTSDVHAVASLGVGQVATGSDDGTVRVWALSTGACLSVLTLGGRAVVGMAVVGGQTLITVDNAGDVRVTSAITGATEQRIAGAAHPKYITAVAHCGGYVVAAGESGTLVVWRLR